MPDSRARLLLSVVSRHPCDAAMAILASAWLVHALIVSRSTELVASDDAFISFQYAPTLALGNGLVFNLGERVWGFTSPLRTLLLALATAAGPDTLHAAFSLGFVSVAAAALLLFRPGARVLWPPFALAVAAFYLVDPSQHGAYAPETNLLVALQFAFLLAAAGAAILAGGLERSLAVAQGRYWGGQRHRAMRGVADWMMANTPVDATIAAGEVGTLAYFSNRAVIDTSGIVTRGYLPGERMQMLPFLQRYRPDSALAYDRPDDTVSGGPGVD